MLIESTKTDLITMLCLNSINALLVLTFIVFLIEPGLSTDYCSKKLCSKKDHACCGRDGSFGKSCPKKTKEIPITEELKGLILKKHNEVRQEISEGNYEGLKNAKRMVEMSWDNSLAEIATCTAKTCVYEHDKCRNTETCTNAGQNIALYTARSLSPIEDIISGMLTTWLNEGKNINMKLVSEFKANAGGQVNNFAQIIRANCSKIGCAIVSFETNGKKNIFLVCNYCSANVPNQPVYEPGPPCSACVTGCSKTSPGLCNTKETYLLELTLLGRDVKLKLLGLG